MVDRISSLPDEILCHILSFLPTEQAVATSILSKRWKPLWISVPILDSDNQTHLIGDIERLVYATIQARDPQQPITSFRLIYDVFDPHRANADVNVWVDTVIQRGIENIEIELKFLPEIEPEFDPDFEPELNPETAILRVGPVVCLSSRIFSCSTLVVLKLKTVSLAASSSVELPALKSLHLNRVNFEEPQYLMELLYGCPVLEDLRTFFIRYANYGSFCEDRVKILPKLVRAEIRLVGIEEMGGNDANVLLKAISNVEFLTITTFQVNDAVPEFPHLRHLGISLEIHSWAVLLMLNNCPKLQSLDFGGIFYKFLPYPHFVPECLTSCLTECYLRFFPGYFRRTYLQFAKYILQNSTYLQVMKIGDVLPSPPEVLEEELALCTKKSASCELSFI